MIGGFIVSVPVAWIGTFTFFHASLSREISNDNYSNIFESPREAMTSLVSGNHGEEWMVHCWQKNGRITMGRAAEHIREPGAPPHIVHL